MTAPAASFPPKASIRRNFASTRIHFRGIRQARLWTHRNPEPTRSDQFHGQLYFSGTSSAFMPRVLSWQTQPGYATTQFTATRRAAGKKASFFLQLERRDINDSQVIDRANLDSNFNPLTLSEAIAIRARGLTSVLVWITNSVE